MQQLFECLQHSDPYGNGLDIAIAIHIGSDWLLFGLPNVLELGNGILGFGQSGSNVFAATLVLAYGATQVDNAMHFLKPVGLAL